MVSFLAFLDQHVTVKRLEVVPRDIFQEITIFGAEVADKIVDEHIVSLSSEVREGCVSVFVFHAYMLHHSGAHVKSFSGFLGGSLWS